jgi:hypothetical protein
MKILILGHGEHGKDTLANALSEKYGLKFLSSSEVANGIIIYPQLENFYDSEQECFYDRRNNRELWASLIRDFNRNDKTRLAKLICESGDGYVGLRELDEVRESVAEGLFTHVMWVIRTDKDEDDPTMTFNYNDVAVLQRRFSNFELLMVINNSKISLSEQVRDGFIGKFLKL